MWDIVHARDRMCITHVDDAPDSEHTIRKNIVMTTELDINFGNLVVDQNSYYLRLCMFVSRIRKKNSSCNWITLHMLV